MTALARKANNVARVGAHSYCSFCRALAWHREQYATPRGGARASRFVACLHYRMVTPHLFRVDNSTANARLFQNDTHGRAVVRSLASRRDVGGCPRRGYFVRVALSGSVPSWEQLNRYRRFGLGEREEQLFLEIWREKNYLFSAASALRSGPTRRQRTCRNSSGAANATPTSSSKASASRMHASPTSSWARSFLNAVWSSPVARKAHNLQVVSSNLTAATNSVSDGVAYGSLPSGESEPSVTLAHAPSEFISCGGVESRHAVRSTPGAIGPDLMRRPSMAAGFAPGPQESSSGDGLGIHQPGSMTRGTRAKVQTPSGRARDRAMCPAVARFNHF